MSLQPNHYYVDIMKKEGRKKLFYGRLEFPHVLTLEEAIKRTKEMRSLFPTKPFTLELISAKGYGEQVEY